MQIYSIFPMPDGTEFGPTLMLAPDVKGIYSLIRDNSAVHVRHFRLLFGDLHVDKTKFATASLQVHWNPKERAMLGCTVERTLSPTFVYQFDVISAPTDPTEAIAACLEGRQPRFEGRVNVIRSLNADLWTIDDGVWPRQGAGEHFTLNDPNARGFGWHCRRMSGGVNGVRCSELFGDGCADLPPNTHVIRVLRRTSL